MWQIAAATALAQGLPPIRDPEIERVLRGWSAPLFTAAGLDPASARIMLVNDPGFNAFAAGGQNVFLDTGLPMTADTAGQAMGVVAHEAGHIAGGHLAWASDAALLRRAFGVVGMAGYIAHNLRLGRGR